MKIQFNYNCQEEFEDTKGLIKIRKSRKDRQHNGQKKDRQHNVQKKDRQHNAQKKDRQHNGQKKDRQHNGQKKMNKNSNNDLQNTTQKTEDRATCASYVEFNHYLLNPTRF